MRCLSFLCGFLIIIGVASGLQISITGLPDDSWKYKDPNYFAGRLTKIFNYKIKDNELGKSIELGCVLSGNISPDSTYSISFNGQNKIVQFQENKHKSETLSSIIRLTNENKTIICTATKAYENSGIGNVFSAELHFYYIPPPPTTTTITTSTSEPPFTVPVTTPPVFLIITGSPKLIKGEYFPKDLVQIYNYNFTDREKVTLKCSLEIAKGREEEREHDHRFSFHVNEKDNGIFNTYQETFISRTFTIQSEDEAIHCIAFYFGDRRYSKVILHYSPLPQDSTPNGGWTNLKIAVLEEKERLWNRAPLQTPNENTYELTCNHDRSVTDTKAARIGAPMWSLVVLAAVTVFIFIAFTVVYLRLRKTVAVLEEKERLWNRAPLQTPNENTYEPAYGHGAGLLRKPKK